MYPSHKCKLKPIERDHGPGENLMLRRWIIVLGVAVTAVGVYLYFAYRLPSGVEPMGGESETVAWIGLATAVVGLLTAVISLVQTLVKPKFGD